MDRLGAESCLVRLRWAADAASYPAVLAQSWATTADMVVPVSGHTATRLDDGRIVAIGGVDTSSGAPVSSDVVQVYDPDSETWAAAGTIPGEPGTAARDHHTATRIGNAIVIVGGFNRGWNGPNTGPAALSTAHSYTPTPSVWRPVPPLASARGEHSAEASAGGTVVVAGGTGTDGPLGTAERWKSGDAGWQTSRLTRPRAGHASVVLADKRIMLTGGDTGSVTTELYDVETNTWRAGPSMTASRSGHTATVLIDGTLMVVGGHDATSRALDSVEVFDPGAADGQGSWSAKAPLRTARSGHVATVQPNGSVVVAAGTGSRPLDSAELYEPTTDKWSRLPRLRTARANPASTPYPGSTILTGGTAAGGQPVGSTERLELPSSYRTSWLGDTVSAADSAKHPEPIISAQSYKPRFVQNSISALWVDPEPSPDGAVTLYANTPFDEGFKALGVYRYERIGSRGAIRPITVLGLACQPNRECRNVSSKSGYAVTGDDQYVYVSLAAAGDRTCIRRYAKSDVAEAESPDPTPWTSQQGGDGYGDRCFAESVADPQQSGVRGLAASDWHLFIADRNANTIQVFDKSDVATARSTISVRDPGQVAFRPGPGSSGSLWAVLNASAAPDGSNPPYVQEYRVEGSTLVPGRKIERDGLVPTGLAVHPSGLLAVTNDHPSSQQVQFFDPAKPDVPEVVSDRIGEPGGVTAAEGEYGPRRLDGPNAVAFDDAGNAYVSSLGARPYVGQSQRTDVRRFSPTGRLDAIMASNEVQNIVAADPREPNVVYSAKHEYTLDLDGSAGPGQEWAPQRTKSTVDRFACSLDGRIGGPGPHQGAPFAVRSLGEPERKYLYVSGIDSQFLGVYRFDESGSIAKPWFVVGRNAAPNWPGTQGSRTAWAWRDTDGDCQFDSTEFIDWPRGAPGSSWQWSVADNGDLLAACFLCLGGPQSIKRVSLQQDGQGSPSYVDDEGQVAVEDLGIPGPFSDRGGEVRAVQYVSATDTLYALGRDHFEVDDLAGGYLLARYDHFVREHGKVKPTWVVGVPDDVARGGDAETTTGGVPSNLTAAGDRVYVANITSPYPAAGGTASDGRVRAYDARTGALRTVLVPGKEVGYRSSWLDIRPYSISATQLANGRRFLYAMENLSGRILIYRDF